MSWKTIYVFAGILFIKLKETGLSPDTDYNFGLLSLELCSFAILRGNWSGPCMAKAAVGQRKCAILYSPVLKYLAVLLTICLAKVSIIKVS